MNESLERPGERTAIGAAVARGGLPAIGPEAMVTALTAYRDLQHSLDKAMPEQIMVLDKKPFRKKGYWRAVALAFDLSVEPIEERREVSGAFMDGRPNFGYLISYRATHPSGRSQTGDGACFAVEKARRFRCPHPENPDDPRGRTKHWPHNTCPDYDAEFSWRTLPAEATEHNVRGHAHTRAYNRAVSNLVGFGEVSAEEVDETSHAVAPETSVGAGKTPAAAAEGQTTTVASVAVKKGKAKSGKEWTRYAVKFADGREGVTFSDTLGERVQALKESGGPANPEIEKTDKGHDLKGLLPLPAAPEPEHPDEPVNGPESVLTVRDVQGEAGPGWVIQTSKRQLVTDKEGQAIAARRARADKLGVVPVFDRVKAKSGRMVNLLTDIGVQDVGAGEGG